MSIGLLEPTTSNSQLLQHQNHYTTMTTMAPGANLRCKPFDVIGTHCPCVCATRMQWPIYDLTDSVANKLTIQCANRCVGARCCFWPVSGRTVASDANRCHKTARSARQSSPVVPTFHWKLYGNDRRCYYNIPTTLVYRQVQQLVGCICISPCVRTITI